MKWTWWRYWRLWLAQTLGLVLFVLAGIQAADPRHGPTREVIIGVATKCITGILAVMVIRIMQDVMDRLGKAHERIRQLEGDHGDSTPP